MSSQSIIKYVVVAVGVVSHIAAAYSQSQFNSDHRAVHRSDHCGSRVDAEAVVELVLAEDHLAALNPLIDDLPMHIHEHEAQILRIIRRILVHLVLIQFLLNRLLEVRPASVRKVRDQLLNLVVALLQ